MKKRGSCAILLAKARLKFMDYIVVAKEAIELSENYTFQYF